MKKVICFLFLLLVLYVLLGCPSIIDAINLRLFASPEYTLNRFYTEQGLAEDQLTDSLILAGAKMVPLLEREILKKGTPRRLYTIFALSVLGNSNSIPGIEHILQDKGETKYFRAAAFRAIARIDLQYARKIAPQYLDDTDISQYAREVHNAPTWLDKRSYWDALFHRHY